MKAAHHLNVVGEDATAGGYGSQQSPSHARTVLIDSIVVRTRIRKSVTNIESLAKSIANLGLLHPPAVRDDQGDLVLVAGLRRLEACRSLGWAEVPVWVCDSVTDELKALQAEAAENSEREPLSPAELYAYVKELLPRAEKAAKDRRLAGNSAGGKSTRPAGRLAPKHEAIDDVGKAFGVSGDTIDRIAVVFDVAADPTQPEKARTIAQQVVATWEDDAKDAPSPTAAAKRVRAAGGTRKGAAPRKAAAKPSKPVQATAPVVTPPVRKPVSDLAKIRQVEDETKYAAMLNAPPGDVPNIPLVDRVNRLFEIVGELIAMPAEKAAGHLHARIVHRYAFPEIGQWLIDFAEACEKRRMDETPDLDRKIYRPTPDNINPVILGTETVPADGEWQLTDTEKISLRWLRKQDIEVTAKSAAVGMKMSVNGARLRLDTLVQRGFAEKWADETRTTFYRVKML